MTLRPIVLLASIFLAGCPGKPDDSSENDDSNELDDSGDDSATDDTNDPAEGISSISIDPDSLTLYRYERVDLALSGVKEDSTIVDLTGDASWSSADEMIAFVTPEGQVEGRGEGSTTITATLGSLSDSLTVEVGVFNLTGSVTLHGMAVANTQVDVQGPVDSATFITSEVDGTLRLDGLGVGTYTLTASLGNYLMQPEVLTITLPDDAETTPEIQIVSADYPTQADRSEPDNDAGQANLYAVGGPLQQHTLWTYGDEDWFAMNMLGQTEYEIFTTNLCASCDTYLEVYDADGTSLLVESDDHGNGYNSRAVFTPEIDGVYFARVRAFEPTSGVAAYFFGAGPTFDNDGDEYGAFEDCDDGNDSINGWAREVSGDGIDNNCDGYSAPSGTTADADETTNNDPTTAIELIVRDWTVREVMHQGYWVNLFSRTLHDTQDTDWFHVAVPAHSLLNLLSANDSDAVRWIVWDSTRTTALFDDTGYMEYYAMNEDETPMDLYIQALEGSAEGSWIAPLVFYYGMDADEDGYYTQDWDSSRDCDDSDDTVRDECY